MQRWGCCGTQSFAGRLICKQSKLEFSRGSEVVRRRVEVLQCSYGRGAGCSRGAGFPFEGGR